MNLAVSLAFCADAYGPKYLSPQAPRLKHAWAGLSRERLPSVLTCLVTSILGNFSDNVNFMLTYVLSSFKRILYLGLCFLRRVSSSMIASFSLVVIRYSISETFEARNFTVYLVSVVSRK